MTEPAQSRQAAAEARHHHLVPASYLAGFTSTGTKDGRLYVWNLDEGKGWFSTPAKAGKQRDYYRLEGDADRPLRVETGLGFAETEAAPILKRLIECREMPETDDLGVLLIFLALLESRSSGLRESLVEVTEERTLAHLRTIFEDETRWHELREKIRATGYDVDSAPVRLAMLEAVVERRIRIDSPQDLRVSWVGRMFRVLFPWLRERHWALLLAPKDRPVDFITSDRPVTLFWSDGTIPRIDNPQFDDRETDVVVPLSRDCALIGRYEPVESGPASPVFAAAVNNRIVLRAHRYLYSAIPNFELLSDDDTIGPAPGLRRRPTT